MERFLFAGVDFVRVSLSHIFSIADAMLGAMNAPTGLSAWHVIRNGILVLCWITAAVLGIRSILWNERMYRELNAKDPERFPDLYSGGLRFWKTYRLHASFCADSPTHKKVIRELVLLYACALIAALAILVDVLQAAFI